MTTTVRKIADQIRSLPEDEFDEFLSWLAEYEMEHSDEWDQQITRDSQPGGKLDKVLKRVHEDLSRKDQAS